VFEATLQSTFKEIFKLNKVTYDEPSDSREQECLFIEIEESRNSIKDGRQVAKVTGNCKMFVNADKMQFGFFSKALKNAPIALTKDLYPFDIEANSKRYGNIVERGFSFVYFFDSQYDPAIGTITSIDITVEET